ncbi:MAG: DKNYY domain-containing protein [Sebaldella sp.]|nr:DKNYY domain-containing protein [Sebaldella sp.]
MYFYNKRIDRLNLTQKIGGKMKKIFLYLLIISISTFACKDLMNPTDPYFKVDNKIYYKIPRNLFLELQDVDVSTFETISITTSSCEDSDYGKDSKNVYFKNFKIKGADAESFEMLGQGYFKDKRYVYFHGERLEDSDSRKGVRIVDGNEDKECIPWGDGGCVLNNGFKYLRGKKILKNDK